MLLQSEAGVVQPIFRIECGGIFTWKTVSRGGVLFWKTRKVFRIDLKGVSLLQHSISVTTCVKYYLHLDVWKRSSTANRPIPWIIPRIMQWQAAGGDDNTLYSFVIHFVLSACLKNEQPRRWGGFNETKCSEFPSWFGAFCECSTFCCWPEGRQRRQTADKQTASVELYSQGLQWDGMVTLVTP